MATQRKKSTRTRKSPATRGRKVVSPRGKKRYMRRRADGTFSKNVSVGRSLAQDRRSKAKKKVPKGQGDRGDVKRSSRSRSRSRSKR